MKKSRILAVTRDQADNLVIETDSQIAVCLEPHIVEVLDKTFKTLKIDADDYESFCQELEARGLPRPSNAATISGGFREELSLPNLNEFNHPIQEAKTVDPKLFVDKKLSIPDLFEFEIDINKPLFSLPDNINLDELFEFGPKTKKKQKK